MAGRTYHVSEIVGTSDEGVDAAIRNGLAAASQTMPNLGWFEVVQVRGHVHQGVPDHFQVSMKVGYRLED